MNLLLLSLLLLPFCHLTTSSSLTCSSLPEFEQFDPTLYFACTCTEERGEGQFSLASFAYNLSQAIFDRRLVVDFRDCWSLDIIMDQLDLHSVQSQHFRPDFQFKEVNVENIFQVHLVQSPPSSETDYINYPNQPLTVHLYSVTNVVVDSGAHLDHLTTQWDQTKLTIDLTTTNSQPDNHDFGIAGFKHSNIFFRTHKTKVELQQMSEFQDVFHSLRHAVLTRSKQMSLGLGLCVFVLTLGVGAMMLATIKRHQLLIESVVYSSIGSLKRIKDKTYVHQKEIKVGKKSEPDNEAGKKSEKNSSNDITTTTTQVDFFPRYSLVNKSQRGAPRHLKEKKSQEAVSSESNQNEMKKEEKTKVSKSQASSINEIFSTLKFSSKRKSKDIPKTDPKPESKKAISSFYYQHSSSDSSCKYDLTTTTTAQVHQPSNPSPQPLLQDSQDKIYRQTGDKIYSFRTLQEKCRKMIAGSKPFQDSTKL